jgi:hypothetical protein
MTEQEEVCIVPLCNLHVHNYLLCDSIQTYHSQPWINLFTELEIRGYNPGTEDRHN